MNDAPNDAVILTVAGVMLLSLATLFRLFQKHIDGRPLLDYEPRRPVPWNFLAPLVMLAPLALALWSTLWAEATYDPAGEVAAATSAVQTAAASAPPGAVFVSLTSAASVVEMAERITSAPSIAGALWLQSFMTVLMALGCYVFLTIAFGARTEDLGLPQSWRQFRGDVCIGATAWAASMAPIYLILYVLFFIFEEQASHPLIEELVTHHSFNMMAAAAFTAVVAAPFYEETAFRLVFQGWMERRDMLARPVVAHDPPPPETFNDEIDAQRDLLASDGPAPPTAHVTYRCSPPGWGPVLISSVLFGLAHYGHGTAPAPLILLGVVLGYLYQRTHRITPCIVCHALFNAYTFVLLALQFSSDT